MKKIILDDLIVEQINDEYYVIHGLTKSGEKISLSLSAKTALQLARLFINWVCDAWLD